ncbi:MAG TPA: WbuC family cupin fold metalloprotein [Chloroflexota bacterium]|nr:WbuC family cupin fold metalloprotein [Chloroflexota bacterium]
MIDASPFNDEVYYSRQAAPRVTAADLAALKELASSNPRERVRLCIHSDVQANVHEMVIVHSRQVYVRPHKHANKSESYHLIEGSALAVMFDDEGAISDAVELGDAGSGTAFLYRLPANVYHCLVFKSDWVVFHETTSGPFNRADTVYAPWAPADDDREGISIYTQNLNAQLRERLAEDQLIGGAR